MLTACYPERIEAPGEEERLLRVAGGWVRQTFDGETGESVAFKVTDAEALAWMLDHRTQLPAHKAWDGFDGSTLYRVCGGWFWLPDLPPGERAWVGQLTDIDAAAWFIANNQPLPPELDGPEQREPAGQAMSSEGNSTGRAPSAADTTPSPYRFQLRGDTWQISYNGVPGVFKDSRGLQHIARLLASPRKPISAIRLMEPGVLDLPAQYRPGALDDFFEDDEGKPKRLQVGWTPQPALDEEAKEKVRQRMTRLAAEIKEADGYGDRETAERLRKEFDAERKYLKSATGLGGRDRDLVRTTEEKARQAVRHALDRAYDVLREAKPPQVALVEHLQQSIQPAAKKSFTYYPQPDDLPWQL